MQVATSLIIFFSAGKLKNVNLAKNFKNKLFIIEKLTLNKTQIRKSRLCMLRTAPLVHSR